jgi:hypothetical protein
MVQATRLKSDFKGTEGFYPILSEVIRFDSRAAIEIDA